MTFAEFIKSLTNAQLKKALDSATNDKVMDVVITTDLNQTLAKGSSRLPAIAETVHRLGGGEAFTLTGIVVAFFTGMYVCYTLLNPENPHDA